MYGARPHTLLKRVSSVGYLSPTMEVLKSVQLGLIPVCLLLLLSSTFVSATITNYPFYNTTYDHASAFSATLTNHNVSANVLGETNVVSFSTPPSLTYSGWTNTSFTLRFLFYNTLASNDIFSVATTDTLYVLYLPSGQNITVKQTNTSFEVSVTGNSTVLTYTASIPVVYADLVAEFDTDVSPLSIQLFLNGTSLGSKTVTTAANTFMDVGTTDPYLKPSAPYLSRVTFYDGLVTNTSVYKMDTSDCYDLIQDGTETGIDCGGSCTACVVITPSGSRGDEHSNMPGWAYAVLFVGLALVALLGVIVGAFCRGRRIFNSV